MMYFSILNAVLAVFAICLLGALIRRINWLTRETDQSLMAVIIRVLMPALILDKTLGNAALKNTANLLPPMTVGAVTVMVGFALSALVAFMLRHQEGFRTPAQRGTFALSTGLYNYSYIPLSLAALLFKDNDATLGVLFVHNVGIELVMWTFGVLILTGHFSSLFSTGQWKKALNPPSLTVLGALLLNFMNVRIFFPPFLNDALRFLGSCAIPLSLLLVGATIADHFNFNDLRRGFSVMLFSSLLRLLILPMLFLSLLFLPSLSKQLKNVIIMQAAMPAAMFPVVMAKYFHGDPPTAMRIIICTSLLALLTIPFWLALGLSLLPP